MEEKIFNSDTWAALLGVGIIFAVFVCVIFIAILVFYLVGKCKLYKKAGRNGWEAIVPFYSDWVYVEMAGLKYWYFFLLVASSISVAINIDDNIRVSSGVLRLVSLIGLFFCNYNISKKIHKDTLFAVLMTLFPLILIPLVGFSNKYEWDDSVVVNENGPINDNPNSNSGTADGELSNNNDYKFCTHCGAKIDKNSKFCSKCGKEI